jgi:hypothetical protein
MSQVLIAVLLLSIFGVLYAIAGYHFYSIYWEKLWIGIPVVVLMAVPYYFHVNHLYSHFWFGTLCQTVWMCSCFGFSLLFTSVRTNSIRKLQERRDQTSAVLSASLDEASKINSRFALYLRPFVVTDRLPTSLPGTHYTGSRFDGFLDFEGILQDSVRDTTPLVALGRPMETYGAGRILTDDENWKAKVTKLMEASTTIFLIPSNHAGTLWEIQQILQSGWLEKCIFIMPPVGATKWTKEPGENWHYDKSLVDAAADWSLAQEALTDLGIHLPAYEQTGAIFTVNRSTLQERYEQLPLLLPNLGGAAGYTQQIARLIAQLQDHSAAVPLAARKSPTGISSFLEHQEQEVRVKRGEFERLVHFRTRGGIILWSLGIALVIYLIVSACRNIRATLWLAAQSLLAYIFTSFLFRLFEQEVPSAEDWQ